MRSFSLGENPTWTDQPGENDGVVFLITGDVTMTRILLNSVISAAFIVWPGKRRCSSGGLHVDETSAEPG